MTDIAHRVLVRYLEGAKAPPVPKRYETRGVLGAAYRGKDIDNRALLTHSVEINEQGSEVAVLCRGVRLGHITDPYAFTKAELEGLPTCQRCLERLERLKAKGLALCEVHPNHV